MPTYEDVAKANGWVKYKIGQPVMPPDNIQEWWYHSATPEDDWYNSAKEICDYLGYKV